MAGPPDLITLGECLAVVSPDDPGPLRTVHRLRLSTAGSESNVAIGFARLGGSVCFVGRVGADELGSRVVRDLQAEGVDLCVYSDPDAPTGLMIKEPQLAGRVQVRYYRRGSAGSRLSPDDLAPGLVESARWLHLTGITPALSSSALAAVTAAADRADTAGVPVSVDLNLRRSLWPSMIDFAETVRPLVARATCVVGGAEEAAVVLGPVDSSDPEQLAAGLADLGPRQVVIKGGAGETTALVDGIVYRRPAYPVQVINTVGAGDAFVAGWLAAQLGGVAEPADWLRMAAACGAYACTVAGDWEALPTRAELDTFLAGPGEDVSR